MRAQRRTLLAAGAAVLTTGLAGCNVLGSEELEESTGVGSQRGSGAVSDAPAELGANAAVAAEWNAMRARLWDALALGVAGAPETGAAVARHVFARFEQASGDYGAHEMLELTSEANYHEFEEALGELRTAGLQEGDLDRAREETTIAETELAAAQRTLVGEPMAQLLDLQVLGLGARDAAFLAAAGQFEGARATAETVRQRFEASGLEDALESAETDIVEGFHGAVEAVESAARSEDSEGVQTAAWDAFQAAIDGSYALSDAEATAGAGHVAALQALGWDAAALARMGGPAAGFAHAAVLTVYRARIHDARWLAASGKTDRALGIVSDVFAHFEGARAHDALETTDGEAYEGFEAGLSDLQSAIEEGNASSIDAAVSAVDGSLVAGIDALAGSDGPLLEAAFFRLRFADARERYRLDQPSVAAGIAEGLFQRFERNELDLHESVESTNEDLYTRFEAHHLAGLIEAFEDPDDDAVDTHYEGVQSTLLEFETLAGSETATSTAEAAFVGGRGFDAAVLDALGEDDRARGIAQGAFEHVESGAGGYHDALEAADESVSEAIETQLGAIARAASDGEDVSHSMKRFTDEVVASAYAIVGRGGGSEMAAAAGLMRDVFAHFEEARVHDALEAADHNAYATFEAALDRYITALQEGGAVRKRAEAFARASQYAEFALLDSVEQLPLDLDLAGTEGGESGSVDGGEGGSDLEGGPNVVDGVPENADHVVEMHPVTFDPDRLTVSVGETVAWSFAGGEPHTVTATEDGIPAGATYWASGGFESAEAAREGWKNGKGAIVDGQSYVQTFETPGTHAYVCIPHEAAGMVGRVVVED